MGSQDQIKVDTGKMISAAASIEIIIKGTRETLEEIKKKVDGISPFWEGMGADAHLSSFHKRMDSAETYTQAIMDSAKSLKIAAGIYDDAEKGNIEMNSSLESEVIS